MENCPHKPHKQYHVVLGFLLVYMGLILEADADEQSGKPICKHSPLPVILKNWMTLANYLLGTL